MPDPHRQQEQRWIEAARRGDRQSFAHLVQAYSRTLIAMAYRYTRDWEMARDLTQETWLRVYRGLEGFRSEAAFLPWLLTIHRNGCLSHGRALRRRPREVPLEPGTRSERSGGIEPVAPPASDPARAHERRRFWQEVRDAVRSLTPRQQEVFALVDLEGLRPLEAAGVLDMKPTTLRVHLHTARNRLAELLSKRGVLP